MGTRPTARPSGTVLVLSVVVLSIVAAWACAPRLSSGSSEILSRLGSVSGFSGSGCPPGGSAERMMEAYLVEIGRRPSEPLSVTVPKFARRAAGICPQSQPTISVSTAMEVSQAQGILRMTSSGTDAALQLEPWLRANVDAGKVVSLTLDLARLGR
jgi:hypothetical protein